MVSVNKGRIKPLAWAREGRSHRREGRESLESRAISAGCRGASETTPEGYPIAPHLTSSSCVSPMPQLLSWDVTMNNPVVSLHVLDRLWISCGNSPGLPKFT